MVLLQIRLYLLDGVFYKVPLHILPFVPRLNVLHKVDMVDHDGKSINIHPSFLNPKTKAVQNKLLVFVLL